MIAIRKTLCSLAALCLMSAAARAQTPPPSAPLTADGYSAILTPAIDNQTLLVAHLDVARIDLPAFEKFLSELLDAGKVPVGDENRKQLAEMRLVADAYLSKFQSTGGRHVFYVLSHADLWPFTEPPVALLMPIENNGDPQPLLDFLKSQPIPPEQHITTEILPHNIVFFGTQRTLAHLKSLTTQPRPEFVTALAASEGAAFQAVYVPTPDIRRVIAEMMPAFPPDSPVMPGASTEFLSRHVKYVSLSFDLPPNPSATFVGMMDSPDDAQKGTLFLKSVLQYAESLPDYQKAIATTSPDEKPQMDAMQLLLKDVETSLSAAPAASEVKVHLDAAQFRAFFQFAEPAFAAERANADHVKIMNSIRQLLLAGNAYAADHKGAWPVTLDEIRAGLGKPAETTQTPYEYHAWSVDELKKLSPAQTPVIWEISDNQRKPLAVGFIDGHVELVPNNAALGELLQKADQQLHPK